MKRADIEAVKALGSRLTAADRAEASMLLIASLAYDEGRSFAQFEADIRSVEAEEQELAEMVARVAEKGSSLAVALVASFLHRLSCTLERTA